MILKHFQHLLNGSAKLQAMLADERLQKVHLLEDGYLFVHVSSPGKVL